MEARVEQDEALIGPQQSRPYRDPQDLGPAIREEGRAWKIDDARAQQRELEQTASVRSRDA